jgi:hypothetical protein
MWTMHEARGAHRASLTARRRLQPIHAMMLFASVGSGGALRAQQTVPVDVQFSLTTPDNRPIAGATVRLVIGAAAGWQQAHAGQPFVTDARGTHRLTVNALLESRQRKMPTNFWSDLVARAQHTDHMLVAAELPYVGTSWLYVGEVDAFADGTNLSDSAPRVYGAGATGNFTVAATVRDGVWSLPGVSGALTTAGHEFTQLVLTPNATRTRWSLTVAMRRQPEPVRR